MNAKCSQRRPRGRCVERAKRAIAALGAVIAAALLTMNAQTQVREAREIAWEGRIEVASGEAQRGPWRMNESDFRYVDDASVTMNDGGVIALAWVDQRQKDVFLQIYEPDGRSRFDAPVNVSESPEIFSWLPRIVLGSGDAQEVFLLWQEIVFSGGTHGGEIFFARSTNGGRTFAEPLNLSRTMAGAGKGRLTEEVWDNGSLDLARAPDGTLCAAWTEYEGPLRVARSTDGGRSFSSPMHVAGSAEAPARAPSLTVGADGTVFLAWALGEDQNAVIHLARSTDQARTFEGPLRLPEREGRSDAPSVDVDLDGVLHVAYALHSREGDARVRYARSRDGGRGFAPARTIMGEQGADASFPELRARGGRVVVLAERITGRAERARGLLLTYSDDGGQRFSPPWLVPGSVPPLGALNGSLQSSLMSKLALNERGSIAIANSVFESGRESRVWLLRGGFEER